MIRLADYQNITDDVRIICTDGSFLDGQINYIDDPDESGIDEWGISFTTVDGGFVEIGESEIKAIERLE